VSRSGDVLLGIDLGTSNLKCVGVSAAGDISELASVPITSTIDGRVYEQDPDSWWDALQRACAMAARSGFDLDRVAAVGLTGHMHGTVLIDGSGDPTRPCITWADMRAVAETRYLRSNYEQQFRAITLNEVDVVFTAPKLLWIAHHDAHALRQARWIISPKDFLRARLTGGWGTERTDAAGTMLLDVAGDEWSSELLDFVGIERDVMPRVAGSREIVGAVSASAGDATGLPVGVPVVAGSGDIASATLGAGMVRPGQVYINVGTAAQVLSIHGGLSAPSRYWLAHTSQTMSIHSSTVFGAGLAHAAVARSITSSDTGSMAERFSHLDAEAAGIAFGAGGLMFIPSLASPDGERESHGMGGYFIGSAASPLHRYRAVLEGVALAIESLIPEGFGSIRVGGGIRRSGLWLEILSSILDAPIEVVDHDASPVGAAMLAGVGLGWFASLSDAAAKCVPAGREVIPSPVEGLVAMKERFLEMTGEVSAPARTNGEASPG